MMRKREGSSGEVTPPLTWTVERNPGKEGTYKMTAKLLESSSENSPTKYVNEW
jgi:hypothetical protein